MGPVSRCIVVAALLMIVTVCGASSPEMSLMETMPAGHAIYLTFSPDAVGMHGVLASLGRCLEKSGGELPSIAGMLGFQPFDWGAWSENLALTQDREIGVIVDTEDGDLSMVTLLIPTNDPVKVEELFVGMVQRNAGFNGEFSISETGGFTVLAMAQDRETLDSHVWELDSGLAGDREYRWLREKAGESDASASVYLDGGAFPDMQGVAGAMLICRAENCVLQFHLLVDTDEAVTGEFGALLTSGPSITDVRLPQGVTTALRVSLDMKAFSGFLSRQGLDREFGQGISAFGVGSLQEFLDVFSGDILIGLRFADGIYTSVLAIGLSDVDMAHKRLEDVHALAVAAGESIDVFEINRTPFYSIDNPGAEGMGTMEVGVVDRSLVVTSGIPIIDVIDGLSFTDLVSEAGLGLPDSGGALFFSDMAGLSQVVGARVSAHGTDVMEALVRISGSLAVEGGLFHARLNLEMTGATPFAELVDMVGTLLASI